MSDGNGFGCKLGTIDFVGKALCSLLGCQLGCQLGSNDKDGTPLVSKLGEADTDGANVAERLGLVERDGDGLGCKLGTRHLLHVFWHPSHGSLPSGLLLDSE